MRLHLFSLTKEFRRVWLLQGNFVSVNPRLRCSRTESVTQESALQPRNCRYKLKVCSCSCPLHCACLPSGHTLFKRRKKNKEKELKTKRLCSIWRTICVPVFLVAELKARNASAAPQPFLRPENCRIPTIRSGITPSGSFWWPAQGKTLENPHSPRQLWPHQRGKAPWASSPVLTPSVPFPGWKYSFKLANKQRERNSTFPIPGLTNYDRMDNRKYRDSPQ